MTTIIGQGDFKYQVAEGWGKLPAGWKFGDVAAVGIDSKDRVYAFNRGEHPMVVFDREGNFLNSWGEGVFKRAHGVQMGPDDTIYLTDDGDHTGQSISGFQMMHTVALPMK
jgi:glucose/arabinose dehydrogenase